MLFLLLQSLLVAVCVDGKVHLPSYFEKCSKSDPVCFTKNFNTAMERYKNGDAKLGVPSGEPIHLELLDVPRQSSGPVALRQKYTNVDFYGSSIVTVANMTVDFTGDNCLWSWTSHATNITMVSDYEVTGQILLLPINSHGKCRNVFLGIDSTFKLACERYTNKKGKTHIRFTDMDYDIVHVDKIEFYLSSLIEGNEKINEELLKTLNENAVTVFDELKGGIIQGLVQFDRAALNSFFAKFSEDELFEN